MQHHTELVTSGRAETLPQVCLTSMPILCSLSILHGLAGVVGELKLSVMSAGIKQQGQGAAGSTEGMEIAV